MTGEKPMTTKELFDGICGILEEKGKLPDILDYRLSTGNPVPITDDEFVLKNNLDYGGSEGIYLDIWIGYYRDGEQDYAELGTFKTLGSGDADMHIMASLLADFIIEADRYIRENRGNFNRKLPHKCFA